ncbi:MAG: hypothetical protein ACKVWR_21805 [Acidimicrobiales bacterium]
MSLAEELAGQVSVILHERVTDAVLIAVTNAQEEGRPFTQLQQADLWSAVLQAMDGCRATVRAHLEIDAMFRTGMIQPPPRGDEMGEAA